MYTLVCEILAVWGTEVMWKAARSDSGYEGVIENKTLGRAVLQ